MKVERPVEPLDLSHTFTCGTDPEMFVFSGKTLLPAFEYLPPKTTPMTHPAHFAEVYWDGFQAEFKLRGGVHCLEALHANIQSGLHLMRETARKHDSKAELSLESVVRIDKKALASLPDEYVELGCMPSENAYGLKGTPVENPRELLYRFAGGHMHFGSGKEIGPINAKRLVKTLDAILGVWAVGAAQSFDKPIRRQYYGLAGEYRTPRYPSGALGIEYRTLSNFWLCHPAISQITWEIARLTARLGATVQREFWRADEAEVIEAIQNSDVKLAKTILKRNEAVFMWMFQKRSFTDTHLNRAFNIGMNGIESEVKDPTAVSAHWGLLDEQLIQSRYYTMEGSKEIWTPYRKPTFIGNNFRWQSHVMPYPDYLTVGVAPKKTQP